MPDMTAALDRIVQHLRRLGRGAPDRLQRGLSNGELASWEAETPIRAHTRIGVIYQWRNGTRADPGDLLESLYAVPGFYFLSIEEAIETVPTGADKSGVARRMVSRVRERWG